MADGIKNRGFVVRKSKTSIIVGFSIVEPMLLAILFFLIYMWFDTKDDPILRESINFPFASFTLIMIAIFCHTVLLMGLCSKFIVNGDKIELHRFLRRTKTFRFTDIKELRDVTITKWSRLRRYGVRDFKIVGHGNKCLGYLQSNDRNFDLFVRTFRCNGVKQ